MAKAVRFDRYGGTDVLYVADVDVPSPAAGEVVVKVEAAGINPGEASIRKGLLDAKQLEQARAAQTEGVRLDQAAVQLGFLSEETALRALAHRSTWAPQ